MRMVAGVYQYKEKTEAKRSVYSRDTTRCNVTSHTISLCIN